SRWPWPSRTASTSWTRAASSTPAHGRKWRKTRRSSGGSSKCRRASPEQVRASRIFALSAEIEEPPKTGVDGLQQIERHRADQVLQVGFVDRGDLRGVRHRIAP